MGESEKSNLPIKKTKPGDTVGADSGYGHHTIIPSPFLPCPPQNSQGSTWRCQERWRGPVRRGWSAAGQRCPSYEAPAPEQWCGTRKREGRGWSESRKRQSKRGIRSFAECRVHTHAHTLTHTLTHTHRQRERKRESTLDDAFSNNLVDQRPCIGWKHRRKGMHQRTSSSMKTVAGTASPAG